MKNKIILTFLFLNYFICLSQKEINWEFLSKVEYEEKYFSEFDEYYLFPTFSSDIKTLNGKEITITGYFLDIDAESNVFILSKGPMSSCFFCGGGGPETAIELYFVSKPNFQTDDIVTITGVFNLNSDDVEHFNYILKKCKGVLSK